MVLIILVLFWILSIHPEVLLPWSTPGAWSAARRHQRWQSPRPHPLFHSAHVHPHTVDSIRGAHVNNKGMPAWCWCRMAAGSSEYGSNDWLVLGVSPGTVIRLDILYPVIVSGHVELRKNFRIHILYNFSQCDLEKISTYSNPNTDLNGQTNN